MVREDIDAIRLSVIVAVAALVIAIMPAIACAWFLAKSNKPGKLIVDLLVNLPLVLPPVVTGYLLLLIFGRTGVAGSLIQETLGIAIVFDWKGAALASAIVAFPLIVGPIQAAFASFPIELEEAAFAAGASRRQVFWTLALPHAKLSIAIALCLGFARSLGEFGATIMIAGNIPGETQTMPLLIFQNLQAPGGIEKSIPIVVAALSVSALSLLARRWAIRGDRW